MEKIVIIGNGIAGITCARHIRKRSDAEITIISSESKYFFSRTALMYVYMGHMEFEHTQPYENWFWKKNRITLIQDTVTELITDRNELKLVSGTSISYDKLVLALGSKSRKMDIEGVGLKGVQSLYSKQDLELMEMNTDKVNEAVIIGGGLIGIEMAEMLHSRGIKTSLLVREESYWNMVLPMEESAMINRHIISRGIDLKLSTKIISIEGNQHVEAVTTNNQEKIPCQFLGITIGVEANVDFIRDSPIKIKRGIVVDDYLQTSVENIFAIGDCTELENPSPLRRAIEPVWYTGRLMGETLAKTLCDDPTCYQPGNWFNSAKFFDIEYQTYGYVPSRQEEGYESFYWEDTDKERCMRLTYNESNGAIAGINTLGIRIKHSLCDRWINEEKPLREVIDNIDELGFDPEFYKPFKNSLTDQFTLA